MCGQWEKETEVAVAPNLPVAVLLGSDVHTVGEGPMTSVATPNTQITGSQPRGTSGGLIAVTRSQSESTLKTREEPIEDVPAESETGDREEGVDDDDPYVTELPYWGENEVPPPEAPADEGLVANNVEGNSEETQVLDAIPGTLKIWQQEDSSLEKIQRLADGVSMEDPESAVRFYRKDGVLY